MDRASRIMAHLAPNATAAPGTPAPQKHADDVVIVSALRTPIQRARKGDFKDSLVADLVIPVVKATFERTGVNPAEVGDICTGVVLGDGSFTHSMVRAATLAAGVPYTTPVKLVNRQCSSGLEAVANIADGIRNGSYEVGLALGVESMSSSKFKWGKGDVSPALMSSAAAVKCLIPMGITAENLAAKYKISREEQDRLSAESHRRAAEARAKGYFDGEIVPVKATVKDKEGNTREVLVTQDGGIRPGTTPETLAKLRPVFKKKGGVVTAGSASQVSDGAAAVLLCKRSYAERNGLAVLGCFRSYAVAGVPPEIMGIGPAYAAPVALKRAGLTVPDIDLWELNEAFGSVAAANTRKLGLNPDKVNICGGAIALGHPLGCTGNRCVATILNQLKRTGGTYGVVTMCIGTGMGAAAVISRE